MPLSPTADQPAVITDVSGSLRAYRDALGRFATGVTVVTCAPSADRPLGVTVNSFTSVSLDPPLVLFCLGREARSLSGFVQAGAFAVNVLARQHRDLGVRFAVDAADWHDVAWWTLETGAPVLDGSLASFDCRLEARHAGGDHVIMVGRVAAFAARPDGQPLLYDRGRYAGLAAGE
jgi:flavin reductase (DIM6/NTAB) family NADH-FMN oxidoreductase RutF